MKPYITLITLGVGVLQKSIEFYRDKLGFPLEPMDEGQDIAFFTMQANLRLGLYPIEKLAEDAEVSQDKQGWSGITIAHNLGSEAEVDELFADLRRSGVRIIKEPQKVFWGGYSGYFADPDGYLWEVAFNPFWEI